MNMNERNKKGHSSISTKLKSQREALYSIRKLAAIRERDYIAHQGKYYYKIGQ